MLLFPLWARREALQGWLGWLGLAGTTDDNELISSGCRCSTTIGRDMLAWATNRLGPTRGSRPSLSAFMLLPVPLRGTKKPGMPNTRVFVE